MQRITQPMCDAGTIRMDVLIGSSAAPSRRREDGSTAMAKKPRAYYTPTAADLAAHVPPTKTWADEVELIQYSARVSHVTYLDLGPETCDLYLTELVDPPVIETGTPGLPLRSIGRTPERALQLLEKRLVQRTAKPAEAREVLYDEAVRRRMARGREKAAHPRMASAAPGTKSVLV